MFAISLPMQIRNLLYLLNEPITFLLVIYCGTDFCLFFCILICLLVRLSPSTA